MLEEGNYANCKLLEAAFGEGEWGPQWALTFAVAEGVKRTVYLGTAEDKTDNKGRTALQRTVATMTSLGWNQDFDAPAFNPEVSDPGIELFCKYSDAGKERWYISSGGFKAPPASVDQRQNFKTAFRAANGAPKPAGVRPTPAATAPARPTAAPARPGAAIKPLITAKNVDEAWTAASKALPTLTSDAFYAVVETYGNDHKKAEAAFTAEDWSAIVVNATLPEAPFG